MKYIAQTITRISGHRGHYCYRSLICVIWLVTGYLPEERHMKDICAEAGAICGKSPGATKQDMSRAVRDIWEHGDRKALVQLRGRDPLVMPTPKDFVLEVAQIFWCRTA